VADNHRSLLKKTLTRRQILLSFSAIFGIPAAASVYGFGIEPNIPVVEKHDLALPDFPGGMTAVQISDLHFKGRSSLYDRVTKKVNAIEADFIFITGDLVEKQEHLPECLQWLKTLRCRRQAFFCPGNWEVWSKTLENALFDKLDKIGIRSLCNEGLTIPWQSGRFFLAGIDDAFYSVADPKRALADQPGDCCTLVISHAPCVIHRLEKFRVDLLLCGHTHGGQVRIPFVGALKTPPGSSTFQSGFYHSGSITMYVNRGIGTSILPVRVFCPPEITLFRITGKAT